MKKIALSLFVIAASGAYVWNQSGQRPADDVLGPALPPAAEARGVQGRETRSSVAAPWAIAPTPVVSLSVGVPSIEQGSAVTHPLRSTTADTARPARLSAPAPSRLLSPITDIPLPRLRPSNHPMRAKVTRAAMTVAANGRYADGTYTGPVADAYYGPMRIQAIVAGGRLVAIKVLEYPSDRRTSVAINRQALPMLRDEVIAAQSARVDIISGATLTSRAFIESLDAALGQAAGTSL